jgi:hypothetical protein
MRLTEGRQQVVVGETLVDEEIAFVPRRISLSTEAVKEFEEFRKFVYRKRKALWGRESEWLAKGPNHVLRLAGAIAYLEWAWVGGEEPKEIGKGVAAAAVKLVREYFWPHSRAALRKAGLIRQRTDERIVLNWTRARGKKELSREDVRQNALSKRLDAEQTRRLLDGLGKAGWLRQVVDPPGPQGGKPAYRWLVNPLLTPAPETPLTPGTYNNGCGENDDTTAVEG